MKLIYRQAKNKDKDWLWSIFSSELKEVIDKQWGWDEEYQREMFSKNLPPAKFKVIYLDEKRIGTVSFEVRDSDIYLNMLLIESQLQNKGYGSTIINDLKRQAIESNMGLSLGVIKANRALLFYQRNGFKVNGERNGSYLLHWKSKMS